MGIFSAFKSKTKSIVDKVRDLTPSQAKRETDKSIEWFKKQVKGALKSRKKPLTPAEERRREKSRLDSKMDSRMAIAGNDIKSKAYMTQFANTGYLYFYMYDAKWKNTPQLPYYDFFPCTIPIEQYRDGFLGLNMHYLPPVLRAQLFDQLLQLKRDTIDRGRYDKYLSISYPIIKQMGNLYKPCIKRYLNTQFRSQFAKIPFEEWENAVFLPLQDFRGANYRTVWSDSRKKVKS